MRYITVFFLAITGFLTSCKDSEKRIKPITKTSVKSIVPSIEKPISVEKTSLENLTADTHEVVVIEKIPAAGYVYLKVSEKGKKYWMAIPNGQIEIGATYYYDGGMEMSRFESKTLKRTFESIIFAQGVRKEKGQIKYIEKKIIDKGESKVVNIEKAPNGIRIATLFENPKAHQNKQVVIKGQVVKVNNGIMGVNFIHLQDGTKGNGEYDVIITSAEKFKIGDVVTIKGTVVLNKDFGSGYTYDVLIEKVVTLK